MLVRLSIIGAFAAILMLPTTLSAQINPGGAINPGGGFNPGGAINPGGGINPGGAINPGAVNPGGDINRGCPAFLLNIEKRSLPRLMLSGDGLASKDTV
jgi:hypothetical protein